MDSDLKRRLKLYGFGVVLGLIVVSFIYKGKGCKMPGSLKLEELAYQKLEYTLHGECRMTCRNITSEELKEILKNGKVNYDKSEVHGEPCPTYAVEGTTTTNKQLRIVIADCDTISRVVTAIDLNLEKEEEGCDCK